MRKTIAKPLAILAGASIAALALASPASGWTDPSPDPFQAFRLFTPEAKLSADGRRLVVSGMADCGPTEGVVQVAISVLQQETFASSRGFSKEQPCTDAEDNFSAELTVKEGRPSFTAGPAQACGMAQMRKDDGAPQLRLLVHVRDPRRRRRTVAD